MNIWINNTEGKPDAVLTMTFMGVVVIFLKVLLGGLTIGSFVIAPIDAATVAAVLTPTLTAYCARRYTDKKFESPEEPEKKVE